MTPPEKKAWLKKHGTFTSPPYPEKYDVGFYTEWMTHNRIFFSGRGKTKNKAIAMVFTRVKASLLIHVRRVENNRAPP